jgi:hypothetical protein
LQEQPAQPEMKVHKHSKKLDLRNNPVGEAFVRPASK